MGPRSYRALVGLAVVLYVVLGLFYSRTLVTSDDEEAYLALGYLAVTGAITLFQDELTGQRMPLPFYVLGGSQWLLGPDLWVGRLASLALGLAALGFTVAAARRLHGDLAAALAGLLLATQGTVIGYYSTAAYHTLTALIVAAAVWALLGAERPWWPVVGWSHSCGPRAGPSIRFSSRPISSSVVSSPPSGCSHGLRSPVGIPRDRRSRHRCWPAGSRAFSPPASR